MLIVLVIQACIPGENRRGRLRSRAGYTVLAVHAVALFALGVALFTAPAQTAPLWPWKLTPLLAQATGAWLISLGVAATHALLEKDARRLRPAAVGNVLLPVLQSIALARYPHLFE
jgi:hypothetical protein